MSFMLRVGEVLPNVASQVPMFLGYLVITVLVVALFWRHRHPIAVTAVVVVLVFVTVFVTWGMAPYTAVAVAGAAGLAAMRVCQRAEG